MQNYPIDLKVNDPLFMQLIENFSTVPQTRKNTASHMRKLVSRTGRSPFYINHDDAKKFYESCIADIHNKTYEPLYIKRIMQSLKSFYQYLYNLSENGYLDITYPCVKYGNPFDHLSVNEDIPDKTEYPEEDIPSMESIDKLLSCCESLNIRTAVCLAFQMAMQINEIVSLKKEDIVDSQYIKLNAVTENGKTFRFLKIPDDLMSKLEQLFQETASRSCEYVIQSNGNKPYSIRGLQSALHKIVKENDIPFNITFSALRKAGIRLILSNGAPPQEVAEYTGVQGRWLSKYEKVPLHLVKDMCSYQNIEIK